MTGQIMEWSPTTYYSSHEYVSRSELHRLADSVAMFLCPDKYSQSFRGESLSTKAAAMGTLVHRGVLEPGLYHLAVVPYSKTAKYEEGDVPAPEQADEASPDEGLSKKEIADLKKVALAAKRAAAAKLKEQKAEQAAAKEELLELADEHDLWLVPPKDLDRADAIIGSVWKNRKAAAYLRGEVILRGHECIAVYSEVAITWEDESGVPCRALLDRVLVYAHCVVVVDLKTVRHTPTKRRWADSAVEDWLYEQAEFYCRGAEQTWGLPALFLWVVARNTRPYTCGVLKPRTREMDKAKRVNDSLLALLAGLMESDDQWIDKWTTQVTEAKPSRRGLTILQARVEEMEALAMSA